MTADPIQIALLRGDRDTARRLVADRLDEGTGSDDRRQLVAARAFAAILGSDFAGAQADAADELRDHAPDDLLLRTIRTLASAMGGLEVDGPDGDSVSIAADAVTSMSPAEVRASVWAVCLVAEAAMSVGLLDTAERVARRVWVDADHDAQPEVVFAGQTLARALLFQGKLLATRELGGAVDALAQQWDLLALQLVVLATMAYAAALRDDRDELQGHVRTIDALSQHCPPGYLVNGAAVLASYALAVVGDAAMARELLLRGAGGPELLAIQLVDRAYGYELLVAAALSLGDRAEAEAWARRSTELEGLPPRGMASAAVRRTAARMAVAQGDSATSAVLAQQARTMAMHSGGRLDATRGHLLAGAALLTDPAQGEPARLALTGAGREATALGASVLHVLARRDLRSIGLRITGAQQTPMSSREMEVAALLADGRSNADIAQALDISTRTVQSHVARILHALDLPSRAAVPHALRSARPAPSAALLTPRQREVADLVSRGYTNDGIARALGVSAKTVEKHLGDIYRRLGVLSRSGLAALWSPTHR